MLLTLHSGTSNSKFNGRKTVNASSKQRSVFLGLSNLTVTEYLICPIECSNDVGKFSGRWHEKL